jgi:hypothetical protein
VILGAGLGFVGGSLTIQGLQGGGSPELGLFAPEEYTHVPFRSGSSSLSQSPKEFENITAQRVLIADLTTPRLADTLLPFAWLTKRQTFGCRDELFQVRQICTREKRADLRVDQLAARVDFGGTYFFLYPEIKRLCELTDWLALVDLVRNPIPICIVSLY